MTVSPRESLWTLVKGGHVEAALMFQGELGIEVEFLNEGVMAYTHCWPLRVQAVQEANWQRQQLMREGWTAPETVDAA